MYHKANLNRIMAAYTGQDVQKIEEDTVSTCSPSSLSFSRRKC
jgi:hypothetical protein